MKKQGRTILLSLMLVVALSVLLIPSHSDTNVYADTSSNQVDFAVPVTPLSEVPDGYVGLYTKQDLNEIRNNLTGNYILMNDISFTPDDFLTTGDFYNNGIGFLPIGPNASICFQGVFDGNGYTISGLCQQVTATTATANSGLFGYAIGAQISNLKMTDTEIISQSTKSTYSAIAGGIVGTAKQSQIVNCVFSGSVDANANDAATYSAAGGIIGTGISSTIAHCSNYGEVLSNNTAKHSKASIGGISGFLQGVTSAPDGAITGCYNFGRITATNASDSDTGVVIGVGGIAGECYDVDIIEKCGNSAALEIQNLGFGDVEAGGIGGNLSIEGLSNCFNSGRIDISQSKYGSETYGGGIAGYLNLNSIKSCYNVGAVGVKKNYLGVGNTTLAGGISASVSGVVDSCYYLDNMSRGIGNATKPGPDIITGNPDLGLILTETQMMDPSTFAGFDFEQTWEMKQGDAYPFPTLKGSMPWQPLEQNTKYYDGGIGSTAHPYLISSKEQLENVRMNLGANYQLSNSLIFSANDFSEGASYYNNGMGFIPIGENRYNKGFEGTLDGQGYAIVGLYQNRSSDLFSDYYCGLFSTLDGGTIKNLGLVDCDITAKSASEYCGGLVGKAERNALISGCYTTGVVKDAKYVGGIVGAMTDSAQIENCFNTADITAVTAAGGLVGTTEYKSTSKVTNSYHVGSVQAGSYSQDIIGYSQGGTYSGCYSSNSSIMKSQSTYKEFDFENVWRIGAEEHYPFPVTAINKYPLKYYYTITFENRGQTFIPDQRVAYHDKITEPVIPTWYGHTFGGWSLYSSYDELWNFDQDVVEDSYYLYAKWVTDVYTMSFDSNGGSSINSFSGVYGDFVNEPTPPVKQGYAFGGWFINEECTLPWSFTGNILYHDMTLYAKWIPNTYTIKFSMNGGTSGTMAILSMSYDVSKSLTTNTFQKTGYSFLGWATTSTGAVVYKDKASVKNLTSSNGATVTLYAKWGAPITSAVSYNYNSIKVSWASAGGTTSYKIYRATSATGKYYLVHTSASTTRAWIDSGKITGKTYYYKVYPVAGGKTYTHSTYKYAKAIPSTPKVSVAKYTTTSAKVTWTGVSGATKYQIYRATMPKGSSTYGPYSRVYTASSTVRSWIDSGKAAGASYKYVVRAYHLEGTTYVYGNYSTTQYLKF